MRIIYCDGCGEKGEGKTTSVILCASQRDYCEECYPKVLSMIKDKFPRPKYKIVDNIKTPHTPTEPKDDKPSAEIGTRPGAGNPKPTKTRNGAIARAITWFERELKERNEILMVDAMKETGISSGSIWKAVVDLTTEQPNTYEYYQDLTRKYHPKGIRKVVIE